MVNAFADKFGEDRCQSRATELIQPALTPAGVGQGPARRLPARGLQGVSAGRVSHIPPVPRLRRQAGVRGQMRDRSGPPSREHHHRLQTRRQQRGRSAECACRVRARSVDATGLTARAPRGPLHRPVKNPTAPPAQDPGRTVPPTHHHPPAKAPDGHPPPRPSGPGAGTIQALLARATPTAPSSGHARQHHSTPAFLAGGLPVPDQGHAGRARRRRAEAEDGALPPAAQVPQRDLSPGGVPAAGAGPGEGARSLQLEALAAGHRCLPLTRSRSRVLAAHQQTPRAARDWLPLQRTPPRQALLRLEHVSSFSDCWWSCRPHVGRHSSWEHLALPGPCWAACLCRLFPACSTLREYESRATSLACARA